MISVYVFSYFLIYDVSILLYFVLLTTGPVFTAL